MDELREEVGLEADPADLIAFACVSDPQDHVVRYPGGDVTHYFGIWFVLRRWEGDPEPDGDELLEVRGFDCDAPPALDAQLGRGAHALCGVPRDRRIPDRLSYGSSCGALKNTKARPPARSDAARMPTLASLRPSVPSPNASSATNSATVNPIPAT